MCSVELYIVVRRLASLLAANFTFPRPGSRQRKSSLPEIQLISLLVIAVKIYHPFDSKPRYARTLTGFGTLLIDWDVWCKSQTDYASRHVSAGRLGRGHEINVNENDVMTMSGEQLDEYLDWYEKTWVREEPREPNSRRIPQPLLDMFPTGRPEGSSPAKVNFDEEAKADQLALALTLSAVVGSLKFRGIVSEENEENSKKVVKRIGSFYKRYRNIEDLPSQANIFYEAAARSVGTSLSTLVLSVFQMEIKLEKLRDKEVYDDLLEDEDVLSEEEHLESDQQSFMIDKEDVKGGREKLSEDNQELARGLEDNIVAFSDSGPAIQESGSDAMEQG